MATRGNAHPVAYKPSINKETKKLGRCWHRCNYCISTTVSILPVILKVMPTFNHWTHSCSNGVIVGNSQCRHALHYSYLRYHTATCTPWLLCVHTHPPESHSCHICFPSLRVILIGELFSHNFDIFFAQFFNLACFPSFFPNIYVKFNELDFFTSGEFHE